jgi:D-alanyl-D-alanine carboxypeptidase/D-alanyl-D-alanine-endopeptidase (penicillin-binding protein 4)
VGVTPARSVAFTAALALSVNACGPGRPAKLVPAPPPPSPLEALRADLTAIFDDPQFQRSYWGVFVRSITPPQDVYALNAAKLMMPGSTLKILTAAAAAEQLGWDHRFETRVVSLAPVQDQTLRGDLGIIGAGDPSISERSDVPGQLRTLARQVHEAGIARIEGGVVADDDRFDDNMFGDGWTLDNIPYGYSAGISALLYNEGSVDLVVSAGAVEGTPVSIQMRPDGSGLQIDNRLLTVSETGTGTLTLHRVPGSSKVRVDGQIPAKSAPFARTASVDNPTRFFAAAFREALIGEGVEVVGDAIDIDDFESKPDLSRARTIASIQSPPVRDLIAAMMKVSQNQYAEMLMRAVGVEPGGAEATAEMGRKRVREILRTWGIPDDSYIVADGSGLSRYNYVSAESLARILQILIENPRHARFRGTLPLVGRDGTLARRLAGTAAEGKVRAKTGTIDNARSIAGYVDTADGDTFVFAMIANNFGVPSATIDRAADQALVRLATFSKRPTR